MVAIDVQQPVIDGHGRQPHSLYPYLVAGNLQPLLPGMVFSAEPGIYLAGKWGVRIEDVIAMTEESARRLNTASRELTVMR